MALDTGLLHSKNIYIACIIKTPKILQNREINVLGAKKWNKGLNLHSHPKVSRGLGISKIHHYWLKILTTPIKFFYVLRFLKNEFEKKLLSNEKNPGRFAPALGPEGLTVTYIQEV